MENVIHSVHIWTCCYQTFSSVLFYREATYWQCMSTMCPQKILSILLLISLVWIQRQMTTTTTKQYKRGKTVFHKHTKTSFNLSMQILFVNIYLPVLGMFWQMTLFKLIHSLYNKTYIQLGPRSVAQEECCMQDQVHQALELSYSFQGHQENDLLCMMVIHNTIEHH